MALDPSQEGILWEREAKLRGTKNYPSASIIAPTRPRTGFHEIVPFESYKLSEAAIFNLLTSDYGGAWGYREVNVTEGTGSLIVPTQTPTAYDPLTAGFSAEYLYQLVIEDRRPPNWIAKAKTTIKTIADALIIQQAGNPVAATFIGSEGAINLTLPQENGLYLDAWGGVANFRPYGETRTVVQVDDTAMGGMAFLRAYQIYGEPKYRAAYLMALKFISRHQHSIRFPADAKPMRRGEFPFFIEDVFFTWTELSGIRIRDIVALAFLKAVLDNDGDITITENEGLGAAYVSKSLSTIISLVHGFWSGAGCAGTDGVVKNGFTSATPFDYYTTNRPDTGVWSYSGSDSTGSYIDSIDWAMALYGWFAASGYDTKVAAIWTYLMGFSSNASHETASTASKQTIFNATTGTYDPRVALSRRLRVLNGSSVAASDNFDKFYDWGSFGLTAAIASARQPGDFGDAKKEGNRRRQRSYDGVHSDTWFVPVQRGLSGLTFQVGFTDSIADSSYRVLDVQKAAMAGLAYRYHPKIDQLSENHR